MKAKLLAIFALVIVLSSCRDVEELPPNVLIEGTFQSNAEVGAGWGTGKFNYENTLKFNSNGTVYAEGVTKDLETGEVLGYRFYYTGTFSIVDENVQIIPDEYFHMNVADIDYLPKEDLLSHQEVVYTENYNIAENFTKLTYFCPDNECGTGIPYFKLD